MLDKWPYLAITISDKIQIRQKDWPYQSFALVSPFQLILLQKKFEIICFPDSTPHLYIVCLVLEIGRFQKESVWR